MEKNTREILKGDNIISGDEISDNANIASESVIQNVTENTKSETEEDPESDIEQLNNRDFMAHRDKKPPKTRTVTTSTSTSASTRLSEADIKERVAMSIRRSKKKKSIPKRNQEKGREKRKTKDVLKAGGRDFSIFD